MPTLFAITLALVLAPLSAPREPELAGNWFVEVSFPGGMPRTATGVLRLGRSTASAVLSGEIEFHTFLLGERLDLVDAKLEKQQLSFRIESSQSQASFTGTIEGNEGQGTCRFEKRGEGTWTVWRAPPFVGFDEPPPADAPFPRVDAASTNLDFERLAMLVERARRSRSDALVVLKDGKLVCDRAFGKPRGPIEAMSATKSVVSLAIGLCLREGLIDSIDTPVARFFPEWDDDAHRNITIRHLLTHTSGIAADRTTEKIYASENFVEFALHSPIRTPPGSVFFYNNVALNLLPAIVEKAAGERLDRFLGEQLFAPLGITDFTWSLDRSGNPHGMSGLQIRAIDFARVGQMLLEHGKCHGEEVIDPTWIALSTRPAEVNGKIPLSGHGLLWWLESDSVTGSIDAELLAQWRAAGAEPEFVDWMARLEGRTFGHDRLSMMTELYAAMLDASLPPAANPERTRENQPTLTTLDATAAIARNVTSKGLPEARMKPGPVVSFAARGYFGQTLVVVPADRLVAVRQRRATGAADEDQPTYDFAEFETLVRGLVRR
jgi:CubicO group peptidase (beta-lactamase class C family)